MHFSSHYPLKPFQETDFTKLRQVITHYPLATIISQSDPFPIVSQAPLILHGDDSKLLGHFDRNNPHCQHILNKGNIYCLFNGPNAYMTPTIYPDEQYPGWNYVAVHVQGRVKPITDEQRLADLLIETAQLNEPAGSTYTLQPSQRNFDLYIKMILGFEIEILDAKGIFKLAQDKGQSHAELARRYLTRVGKNDVGEFLNILLV